MNTLSRLDNHLSSYFISTPPPRSPSRRSSSHSPSSPSLTRSSSSRHHSASGARSPSGPRGRRRGRRPKPTTSNVKVPPPSTPVLLRILLALWSILLSFWQSLVGEIRAERLQRKRAARLLQHLTGAAAAPAEQKERDDGSGSDSEAASSEDEPWIDPVTRAPETTLHENDSSSALFAGDNSSEPFTFRLPSAEKKEGESSTSNPSNGQLTSILDNPILSSPGSRSKQARLLPNPMSTSLLDPSVPVVPASQTIMTRGSLSKYPPRPHQTPFHLQKTLILDLDETLIHSTARPLSYAASAGGGLLGLSFGGLFGKGRRREGHTVEVVLRGRSTTYHVYKRPYVDHFLKKVASWYTLVIFTASMPEYADPVIDWLDGGRGLFAKRLYREDCCLTQPGSYVKDLSLVEPDLSRVCFMDNSPISYMWNKANALPVEGWTSDPNDEALLHCIPVLDSLRFVNDVRRVLGIRGFW
ncbi:HAD-like domain-containing protein [Kockovaella imperatae]|uniref:HAD-like domain-containing protein n=1 Tax=Kockovaella imperatae TaxID=4999 RepID=A0A1Y1UPY9_9TREE|nr:HAD-like domain-containing protein [Kockovaella imperatae]ORX40069.1 HAD-like domain-containing protein [Kockovaella imperatae]